MKKTILALAALAVGASAYAQESAKSALAVTLDVTYVSDYVFRGLKLADASIQPSVEASYGDFYAGVWHSNDINSSAGASETDFYTGYNLAINETFSADVGVTRYTYNGSGSSQFNSTEAYAGIKADLFGLSPSAYYYHDFDYEVSSYIASIGHTIAISQVGLSLDLSATYGWIQAPKSTGGDYSYWGAGVALPYSLSETATLTAAVNYTHVDRSNFEPFQDRVVFSLGLAVGF
jgi:uncharacterized protein (TIGR02001 family)